MEKEIDELRDTKPECPDWTQRTWPGNPALNLEARVKTFINPLCGHKTQVWVFGKPNDFHFCVAAGAYSAYSYSGSFFPVNTNTIEEYCKLVDERHKNKKLFV